MALDLLESAQVARVRDPPLAVSFDEDDVEAGSHLHGLAPGSLGLNGLPQLDALTSTIGDSAAPSTNPTRHADLRIIPPPFTLSGGSDLRNAVLY